MRVYYTYAETALLHVYNHLLTLNYYKLASYSALFCYVQFRQFWRPPWVRLGLGLVDGRNNVPSKYLNEIQINN